MRHAVRAVIGGLLAALCVLLLPGAAVAAGETVQGRLQNAGEALEGVTITVATVDGQSVGEAVTDAEGAFVIPVPEAGDYVVTLDEETLPERVAIREGRSASITLPVAVDQQRSVLFPLGEGTRNVQSDLDRLPQLAVEGLNFGLIIALAAVGLSLIYGTTGLVNFAHGELITLGALLAYLFNVTMGIQLVPAALLAVVASALLGGVQDRVLWRPLRKKGTGLIAMLVVTIGLALFLRGLFLYQFGGSTAPYDDYQGQTGYDLGPVTIAPKDLISMGICIVMLLAVAYALLRTRIGKATRAVSDNPALAASSGIDVERVISTVWVAGAGLAGLAGILLALAQQVSFQLGFQILLLVFAGVTLGGLGTAFGALVGSLVVGIFTQVSTIFVPTELKNAGALAILILILLVRPQGILGRAERVG
ncbi:MAG: putative branched-chain amino acid transporter permease protein [Frankiales bacterium]|nr:putative branched-chain amino acid transporter permease protein [Frankiales bacterium]